MAAYSAPLRARLGRDKRVVMGHEMRHLPLILCETFLAAVRMASLCLGSAAIRSSASSAAGPAAGPSWLSAHVAMTTTDGSGSFRQLVMAPTNPLALGPSEPVACSAWTRTRGSAFCMNL